jgi:hypothetical protein
MPLTRAQADTIIAARVAVPLARVGTVLGQMVATGLIDATLAPAWGVVGTSPDARLDDPLARALDELGLTPADRTAVGDADLARLGDAQAGRFLDLVTVRLLEMVRQQLSVGPKSQKFDTYSADYASAVEDIGKLIDSLTVEYRQRYLRSGVPTVVPARRTVRCNLDLDPCRGGWRDSLE